MSVESEKVVISQPRVAQVRAAGKDHQVVTVQGGRSGLYRREPCETCPWRCDAVGEFPAEAFRHSAGTAYDMAQSAFSCHSSGIQKPALCAGFLLRNSENNVAVRLLQFEGKLEMSEVGDGGHALFASYRAMAEANGVAPDDPVLAPCRADFE